MTLSLIVKATIILASVLLAARLLHRRRAAVRHVVLVTGFGLLLGLPLASGIMPVSVAVPVPVPTGPRAWIGQPVNELTLGVPERPPSDGSRTVGLDTLLSAAWLAGVFVSLVPVLAGLIQSQGLRRTGLPSRRGQAIADALAADVRQRRTARVLSHPDITGPITFGLLPPMIVLPADTDDWSEQALQHALRHELTHIRRGDWLWLCVSRVVCACYWFHPLAWMAWGRLVLEAERASDDAVLGREQAFGYATLLVAIAERQVRQAPPSLLAMARRSDLSTRVTSLLDPSLPRGRAGRGIIAAAAAFASLVIATTAPLTLQAQAAQLEKLEFGAASVRPNISAVDDEQYFMPTPGRFRAHNVTLKMLITHAYGLRDFQLIGGPDWISEDRYNIEATDPNGAGRQLQVRMLQSLLADRFKLTLHRERRELPIYSLQVAGGGLKVSPIPSGRCPKSDPAAPDAPSDGTRACGYMGIGRESFQATAATMSTTAEGLSMVLDRMVLDRTGVPAEFDITLQWNAVEGPSLFTAIQEQLGLRLEADRGPVEVVVIEGVQRPSKD